MPGSSRRTLPQHQVRDGALRLVSPLQRRRVVQSEVTVGEQQRIKEHGHGIGRPALQPLAQILQILEREREAERRCQNFLWADEASFTVPAFVWESYLLQQRQVRLLPQLAVQQGVRVRRLRWQVGGVTWQQVRQTDAWGAVTWGNTEREREREVNPVQVSGCCSRATRLARGSGAICVSAGCHGYSCSDQEVSLLSRRQKTSSKNHVVTEEPRCKSHRAAAAWLGKFDRFTPTCATGQTGDISTLSRGQRQTVKLLTSQLTMTQQSHS